MKEEEHGLRRLGRKTVCEGAVLNFCRDRMELPDGKVETWDFVYHKKGGGACIVPVLSDGRILMIRQYRPAIDRMTLELPAGAKDSPDEDTAVTAARELAEETGYRCENVQFLCRIKTAVAWCNEQTDIYLAENLVRADGQHLDEAEEIRVKPAALSELCEEIFAGKIQDAKTVAGILAYVAYKQK